MTAAIPWGVMPSLDVVATTFLLFLLDWRLALVAMLIFPPLSDRTAILHAPRFDRQFSTTAGGRSHGCDGASKLL